MPVSAGFVLGIFAAIFTPIWASTLSTGAKAAVTVLFIILVLVYALSWGILVLVHKGRRGMSITSASDEGSVSG
jgi:hypothetical protein